MSLSATLPVRYDNDESTHPLSGLFVHLCACIIIYHVHASSSTICMHHHLLFACTILYFMHALSFIMCMDHQEIVMLIMMIDEEYMNDDDCVGGNDDDDEDFIYDADDCIDDEW